jgi:HK97 gp10 family phage protein
VPTVTITESADMTAMLEQMSVLVQRTAAKKAVRAAGQVVARRARQLCRRSEQTGTRKHWSRRTAAQRAGVKALADTIGVVVREYEHAFVAVVGPQLPGGELGHLVEYGHAEVLWGRATGRRVAPRPFLRPAADETQAEQHAAMVSSLRASLESVG